MCLCACVHACARARRSPSAKSRGLRLSAKLILFLFAKFVFSGASGSQRRQKKTHVCEIDMILSAKLLMLQFPAPVGPTGARNILCANLICCCSGTTHVHASCYFAVQDAPDMLRLQKVCISGASAPQRRQNQCDTKYGARLSRTPVSVCFRRHISCPSVSGASATQRRQKCSSAHGRCSPAPLG